MFILYIPYSEIAFDCNDLLNAALANSQFGSMAKRRLEKYQTRLEFAPKNVMCSELAILAYQLSAPEQKERAGFIRLDVKRSLPCALFRYLSKNCYWQVIGRGKSLSRQRT